MPDTAVNEVEAVRPRKESRNRPHLSRHSLKCAICNHPDRAAIEFDFLNWRNPSDIVQAYRFRGLSTVYRHAHATGLFAKRRLNLRFAMERIVERVNEVPVTANAVIRAARAVSRINDQGEWIDLPSRLIVEHVNSEQAGHPAAPSSATVGSGFSPDPSAEESLVGRGFNRDKKTRSSRSSLRARQARQGEIPDIAARESSAVSRAPVIFDKELLDEPSDSASCELPRINGKPPDPEIVLEIAPSLYGAVQARREAAKVRLAPWSSPPPGLAAPHEGGPTTREQNVALSPSTLPEAASPSSAPSALPHPAARENNVADTRVNVATPSSLLPQAASKTPAPVKQSPRAAGPSLGSAGSANPPFPFDPPPLRQWKPRRRF